MNILILGTGVIGTFWGCTLRQAGHQVTHLLRPGQSASGVPVSVKLNFTDRRAGGGLPETYVYQVTADWHSLQSFDIILLPLKHTQWHSAVTALAPYLSPEAIVLIAGNVWEDDFSFFDEQLNGRYLFVFPHFGGALVNGALRGWLTPRMSIGPAQAPPATVERVNSLFTEARFSPVVQPDMRGWLLTHFAWNAGLLVQALQNDGFVRMTRSWASLTDAFRRIRVNMRVVEGCGVNVRQFSEGRRAFQPLWWNVLLTYLIFRLPGMARGADANRDNAEWAAFGDRINRTSQQYFKPGGN